MFNFKNKIIFMLVIFMFVLSACHTSTSNNVVEPIITVSADDWLRARNGLENHRLNYLDYSIIDLDKNKDLLTELDKKEYVILEETEDGYLIAVRALYTYLGGVYLVYLNDDNSITVDYGVLGTDNEPYHKTALKVFVKKLPSAIYVYCSTVG